MDKIRLRDLQRWNTDDLLSILPIAVTRDSQTVMVVASLDQWNRLTRAYTQAPRDSQTNSQEVDADGHVIPNE